jgi:hypothetical protein
MSPVSGSKCFFFNKYEFKDKYHYIDYFDIFFLHKKFKVYINKVIRVSNQIDR